MDNGPTPEVNNYRDFEVVMLKNCSTKKSEAEIMKEYGWDIHDFWTRAEKVYEQDMYNGKDKFGPLREALKVDPIIVQLILFRGAKNYEYVKKYCLEYANNQKMMEKQFQK